MTAINWICGKSTLNDIVVKRVHVGVLYQPNPQSFSCLDIRLVCLLAGSKRATFSTTTNFFVIDGIGEE